MQPFARRPPHRGRAAVSYLLGVGVGHIAAGLLSWIDCFSIVCALVLLLLAVLLLIRALPALFGKQQPEAEEE